MMYAEELNYWKTSQRAPDAILDEAEKLIEDFGGHVTRRAIAREHGREVIFLEFVFGDDVFRSSWPVLESQNGDHLAARRQAATMVFHDIKNRAVRFKIYGARLAFIDQLVLPDGRQIGQLVTDEIVEMAPRLLNP